MIRSDNKILYITLFCTCLCTIIASFQNTYPVVLSLDIQRDLMIPMESLALISGISLVTFGCAQIPTGILADKIEARKILFTYILVSGLFTLLLAMAHSFNTILLSRFVTGFVCAVSVPCLKLIATVCPAEKFARVSSILMATAPLGSLLATAPLVYVKEQVGWRNSLIIMGVISIVCAVIILLSIKVKKTNITQDQAEAFIPIQKTQAKSIKQNLKLVLKNKTFLALFIWFCCVMGVLSAFGAYWLGPYLMTSCGLSSTETGQVLFASSTLSILLTPLGAYIAESYVKSYKKVLCVGTFCAFLFFLPYCILPSMTFWQVLIVHSLFCATSMSVIPLVISICRQIFPIEVFGTASGCLYTASPLAAAPMQIIFGYILAWISKIQGGDSASYGLSFTFFAIIFFIGFLSTLFIPETFKTTKNKT